VRHDLVTLATAYMIDVCFRDSRAFFIPPFSDAFPDRRSACMEAEKEGLFCERLLVVEVCNKEGASTEYLPVVKDGSHPLPPSQHTQRSHTDVLEGRVVIQGMRLSL
jgi:hypothetical protein